MTFFKGNDLRPATGVVVSRNGNRMVTILDLEDLSTHRRHVDQVEFNVRGQCDSNSSVASNSNDSILDDDTMPEARTISEEAQLRRSERLKAKPPRDYKHPQGHSTCGGCDEH